MRQGSRRPCNVMRPAHPGGERAAATHEVAHSACRALTCRPVSREPKRFQRANIRRSLKRGFARISRGSEVAGATSSTPEVPRWLCTP